MNTTLPECELVEGYVSNGEIRINDKLNEVQKLSYRSHKYTTILVNHSRGLTPIAVLNLRQSIGYDSEKKEPPPQHQFGGSPNAPDEELRGPPRFKREPIEIES